MSIVPRLLQHLAIFTVVCLTAASLPADELGNAVRAALKQADPSIVRLRIIGGEQSVDGDKVTSLVTTGVVISDQGEILTSQFALQGNPEAILVEDQAGHRANTVVVATDHVRRLVLLRAREGQWTAVRSAAPDSVRTGQWSIALGRFYSADSSSVSVGIVSAMNRIHGMAIQSDAKISPVNYGGPLINLQGETIGILIPLSPRGRSNASAGIEWYDSGIGFAIPMTDALKSADRLREGKDLKPGRLGLRLATAGIFSSNIRIDRLVQGGPADLAGLKKGDVLVSVNDRPIERVSILEEAVARSYAGDSITLTVNRGTESLTLPIELTEELPVPTPGYLGFMTVRPAKSGVIAEQPDLPAVAQILQGNPPGAPITRPESDAKSDSVPLVVINNTSASKAGLPERIELLKLNNEPTPGREELRVALADLQAGNKIQIEYRIPGEAQTKTAEIETQLQPEDVIRLSGAVLDAVDAIAEIKNPDDAETVETPGDKSRASGEAQRRELSYEQRGRAIVFSSKNPTAVLPGIVVLLSAELESEEQLLARWKPYLDSHKLIVAVPVNPEKSRLTADDIPLVLDIVKDLAGGSKADLRRIVVVGKREQSRLALQLLFGGPSPIRGIALTDGWMAAADFEGVDGSDQSVLLLETPANAQSQALLSQSRDSLRKAGFWVARPKDQDTEHTMADWTMLLRSF